MANPQAILLAAGLSRRMGGKNKLLMPVAGKPVLVWTLEHVLASQVEQVLLVTGADHAEIQKLVGSRPVKVVHNPDFHEGLGASIRAGVKALTVEAGGAFLLLADQPALQTNTINRFVEVFRSGKYPIVAAKYGNVVGNPVLFDRRFFDELVELSGDRGARKLLTKYPAAVKTVVLQPHEALDIDSPADLEIMSDILAAG